MSVSENDIRYSCNVQSQGGDFTDAFRQLRDLGEGAGLFPHNQAYVNLAHSHAHGWLNKILGDT